MVFGGTCQGDPLARILENYRNCLVLRLELWFGPGTEVLRESSTQSLSVQREGHPPAVLRFIPSRCQWTLTCGALIQEGSFDRLSKRLRQLFSGLYPQSLA